MRILGRGHAAQWTKEKIDSLSTLEVRNLHANAERLLETEIGRACVGKECVSLCRSRWSPYH